MEKTVSTKKCKHCAEQILAEANTCKHCGKKQGTSVWVWILLTPVVLFGAMMVIGSNAPPEKSNARSSIEYCWDNYDSLRKDPTISRAALGLAYDTCQLMVKKFEDQYGYSSTLRKD